MAFNFSSWIKQPSTISCLGGIAGTIVGSVTHVLTGQASYAVAAGAIAYSAVNGLLPDNTAEAKPLQKLVSDAVSAAASHAVSQRLPQLIADVQGVLAPIVAQVAAAPAPAPVPAAPIEALKPTV